MPPPMPLLAGQTDVVEPVPDVSYRPAVVITASVCLAVRGIDDPLAGHRIDAAVGERGAHHGEVPRRHAEAALARVEVERLERVALDAVARAQQERDAAVAHVRLRRRAVDVVRERERPAGEAGEAVAQEAPLLGARTGDEARRRDRAGVDHRVRPAVAAALDCHERVERQPGAVHADAVAAPRRARARRTTSANMKGLATLMSANSTSESPAAKTLPPSPIAHTPKRPGSTRASAG